MGSQGLRLAASILLLVGCTKPSGGKAPWLTMPTTASHAAWFPIGPADVHGAPVGSSPDCDGCHHDKETGLPSSTFRTYTCTGCHVQPRTGVAHDQPSQLATLHSTVAAYDGTVAGFAGSVASLNGGVGPQSPEDGACLRCHPTGFATDHAQIFPLPHQDAAATEVAVCSDCHRDPSDRTRLGCAPCHPHDQPATATAHAAVPDFVAAGPTAPDAEIVAASSLCVRCHAEGAVPVTVAGHAARSGGFVVGVGLHSGSSGGGCLDCHPSLRTDKPFATDFSRYTCGAACHGSVPITAAGLHDNATELGAFHLAAGVDFAAAVTSLGFDGACRSCHGDGSGGLPGGHPFPVGAAPAHTPEACSRCHLTFTARNDAANIACADCHLSLDPLLPGRHTGAIIPVTDYGATGPECLRCHGEPLIFRASAHPSGEGTPRDGVVKHLDAGCTACHQTYLTDLPYAADWGQRDCRPCHPTAGGPAGL
jgi:hypothetical protein